MGKGARSREQNAEKKIAQQAKAAVEIKKRKRDRLILSVIAIVVAGALTISVLVYALYYGNGKYLRDNVTVSSANFKVDNAMMTYFFRNNFQVLQSGYSGYFQMLTGVDPNKSLKNQAYADGEQTWFDNVLASTKESVQKVLVLAEAGKEQGMTLTESDNIGIAARVNALDQSYLKDGVSKEDITRAFAISTLAQKYANQFEKDTTFTPAQVQAHYDADSNTYRTAGYATYTLSYAATQEEGKVPYTQEQAKQKADELEKATSEQEFLDLVEAAILEQQPAITAEDLQTQLNSATVKESAYTADDAVSTWVFDPATAVGDKHVIADDTNSTYAVYYLTQQPQRDESPTVGMRHVLFTSGTYGSDNKAEEKAKEVLALYEQNPETAYFGELAAEYSEDAGSKSRNGLYTGVKAGNMTAEIDTWLFDAARKAGDTEIIKTENGYHIVYFEGAGKAYWQESVETDLRTAAFNEQVTALQAQYAVTFVDNKLGDIPG